MIPLVCALICSLTWIGLWPMLFPRPVAFDGRAPVPAYADIPVATFDARGLV